MYNIFYVFILLIFIFMFCCIFFIFFRIFFGNVDIFESDSVRGFGEVVFIDDIIESEVFFVFGIYL